MGTVYILEHHDFGTAKGAISRDSGDGP